MQETSDTLLVSALRAGSEQAFTEIYRRYYERLLLYANRILHDYPAAEDAMQDIFTRLWQKKGTLPENVTLKSYLYTTVKNQCIDILRKEKPFQQYILEESGLPEPAVQRDPVVNKERDMAIQRAINALPTVQRKIFTLNDDGLSHQEIRETTGQSIQTIKNLLVTARRTLRKKLVNT